MNLRFLIFLLAAACMSGARAHEVELLFLQFEQQENNSWSAEIYFDAGYALPEMRADKDAPQPKREWLTSQTEAEWQRLRQETEKYLRDVLEFRLRREGDTTLSIPWTVTFPDFQSEPPDFPTMLSGFAYMRVKISGSASAGDLEIAVSPESEPSFTVGRNDLFEVVRPGAYLTLMTVDSHTGETVLQETSALSKASGFLWLGYLHVLPWGADHVLFIIALFIYTPSWKSLLKQSLLFTVAHSLTLGLMLAGVVTAEPSIIEPLIALSIAWVAFEHLIFPAELGWRRLSAVFAFGLIHGLGFASSLSQGLSSGGGENAWIMPLISANIGIELAQLTVLGVCIILCYRFLDDEWFLKLRNAAAAIIGLIGLWWCFDRIF